MNDAARAGLGATLLTSVLALAACHEVPKADGDAGAIASQPAAPARTEARPRPSAARSAAQPAVATTLDLLGGGRLKLPAGAMPKDTSTTSRLPDVVGRSHIYRMGDEKHLLMINELSLDGGTCESAMDEELARMKAAKEDTDPKRLHFRRLGDVETLKVKGQRVLYGESKNRGLSGADAGRPMVAMANLLVCHGANYLLILYASDKPQLPEGTKQMLLDLAGSYTPG